MAIYSFQMKNISRGKGQSAIACASYRSGEKLYSERYDKTSFYPREISPQTFILKPECAPDFCLNRERLWNEVEKAEKASSARLAKDFILALPIELNEEEQKEMLLEHCQSNFVEKGMVADISIHQDKDGNPHAHVMTTNRPFAASGEWGAKSKKTYILDADGNKIYNADKKTYKCTKESLVDWDSPNALKTWRENWAVAINKSLEAKGLNITVSDKSYEEQGISKIPTKHLGSFAHQMEQRGVESDNGNINREIKRYNQLIYTQERLDADIKETKETTEFTRHFSPNEKIQIAKLSRDLKTFVDFEHLEDKKRMLNNWKNSTLSKQVMTSAEELEPILKKIQDSEEAVKKADDILKREAERFVKAHYPYVNLEVASDYMLKDLVDRTVHNEAIFEKAKVKEIFDVSRYQELHHNVALIMKDPYLSLRVMVNTIAVQEKKLNNFAQIHQIDLKDSENIKQLDEDLKNKLLNISRPLSRYKTVLNMVKQYHDRNIKEHLPMFKLPEMSPPQKEKLSNAILYFGEDLTKTVVQDVLQNKIPYKFDIETKEKILVALRNPTMANRSVYITQEQEHFLQEPTMRAMFFNECKESPLSDRGKQNLKTILEKDEHEDHRNRTTSKSDYRHSISNSSVLIGLGTGILSILAGLENAQEMPSPKKKKKTREEEQHQRYNYPRR